MAGTSLADAFGRLDGLAERLNSESNALNSTIELVESRLVALNVGLPVWLDHSLLNEEEPPGADKWGRTQKSVRLRLGFAKINGAWRLATSRVHVESGYYEGGSDGYEDSYTDDVQPLSAASREVRVLALEKLPDVVTALADRADLAIKAIDAANGSLLD